MAGDYSENVDNTQELLSVPRAYAVCVRRNVKRLLVLGLLFTLSVAPFITHRYLLVLEDVRLAAEVSSGIVSADVAAATMNALRNTFFAVLLLLALPVAIVLAGSAKVYKHMIWRDVMPARENMGQGIVENAWSYMLCAVVNVLVMWLASFSANAPTEHMLWRYLPTVGYIAIVLPISMWFCTVTAVYRDKLSVRVANAIRLYMTCLPVTLTSLVVMLLPLALLLIPLTVLQIIVPMAYALVYLPFAILLWGYISARLLDKYVNADSFPELVNRGMYEE